MHRVTALLHAQGTGYTVSDECNPALRLPENFVICTAVDQFSEWLFTVNTESLFSSSSEVREAPEGDASVGDRPGAHLVTVGIGRLQEETSAPADDAPHIE